MFSVSMASKSIAVDVLPIAGSHSQMSMINNLNAPSDFKWAVCVGTLDLSARLVKHAASHCQMLRRYTE